MLYLMVSFLAGLVTIATPCIFPVLPFVLARADLPFRRGGLAVLLGLAIGFAAVASLASVGGAWAIAANRVGRDGALAVLMLSGATMLLPSLAGRLGAPAVFVGARLSAWAGRRTTTAASLLLGFATGLVWAPCAGPVLGVILAEAALRGPSLATSLLLLAYGLGAATPLAAGVLLGGRLLAAVGRMIRWGDGLRRILGVAVIAGAACIWLGVDTSLLARWTPAPAAGLEQHIASVVQKEPAAMPDIPLPPSAAPALTGRLASLLQAREWLNTPPPQPQDLRGKVVLVNFWTYSCINCLRMLPHVRAWARTYANRGLVVIGVHTPEFAFERDPVNVAKALSALDVTYPVAIDNTFAVWRAFGNQGWPALYFISVDGRVRHQRLGEGGYDESEQLLRQLLSESKAVPAAGAIVPLTGEGPQAAADETHLLSVETYIGYAQESGFAASGGIRQGMSFRYQTISPLALNRWGLAGTWTIGSEYASLDQAPGRIAYRFHARDLHLVLAPSMPGRAIRFRVTLDGTSPGENHGSDVDREGWGIAKDGRLYQLVRQSGAVVDRTFAIEFFDDGIRAYAFTFG